MADLPLFHLDADARTRLDALPERFTGFIAAPDGFEVAA